MTGFIRGFFGKKQKNAEPPANEAQPQQNKGAYFLSPDDAKTFGDIDYMRTAKTVKRSYAKGSERIRQISALSEQEIKEAMEAVSAPAPQTPPAPSSSSSTFSSNRTPEKRRPTDTSMDMFRNMAKEIRKR